MDALLWLNAETLKKKKVPNPILCTHLVWAFSSTQGAPVAMRDGHAGLLEDKTEDYHDYKHLRNYQQVPNKQCMYNNYTTSPKIVHAYQQFKPHAGLRDE